MRASIDSICGTTIIDASLAAPDAAERIVVPPAARVPITVFLGVGAATAAAHIGNNFTTFLIGGLIDRFGFNPAEMGVWSMAEMLSYAAAMFVVAPRVARLSPRLLIVVAGLLVMAAQLGSAALASYPLLLAGRIVTGLGFGLANTALNLAAGRTPHPARAISLGIAFQTALYALINIGLPMVGERYGVAGMFVALAVLTGCFTALAGWLPGGLARDAVTADKAAHGPLGADGWRVLVAMALFTFGSMAIWPFIERAAHAIDISAVRYGRYQSLATILSALGSIALAAVAARLRRARPIAVALLACGLSCAAVTTVSSGWAFAAALIGLNVGFFITYALLLGIAFEVEPDGRLAVLCSATWLTMMAIGGFATGLIAQTLGSYRPVGPLGLAICVAGVLTIWPLARRLDRTDGGVRAGLPVAH